MKKAKDDKRLQTIPEGSYEAGAMNRELRKNNSREAVSYTHLTLPTNSRV